MPNSQHRNQFTITAVGDRNVGKTFIFHRYVHDVILSEYYLPMALENYVREIRVDDNNYNIRLWETKPQEDYARLRLIAYKLADCILVCFAVNSESSYFNIQDKWIPEIRHHKKDAPVILVGTKADLRAQSDESVISASDCHKLKEQIGAVKYVECSAITREGLDEVFDSAVRAIIINKANAKKKRYRCSVI